MKLPLLSFLFLLLYSSLCNAQRLAPFGSETNKREYGERINRSPYDASVSYFECIDSVNSFVVKENEKAFYTLYFFIDDTLTELGIRVLSPLPELTSPNKGHFATENFYTSKNKSKGFNSFLSISKADGLEKRNELLNYKAEPTWKLMGENDDSKEMENQENSLIRLINGKNNVFLWPGLYRIQISTSEKKELIGSFLLQTGTIPAAQLSPFVSDWRKL
ncbi:MAG: LipL32 family surface lipoprotein [Bacteroidia bacterium]